MLRPRLQETYFRVMNEHLFTTLARVSPPVARGIVACNYGQRAWREYPLFETAAGRELLFIHLPKCAGTSIARAFGLGQIRHLPAAVFHLSDADRFERACCFAVLRDPAERLASALQHYRSSEFASDEERALFAQHAARDDMFWPTVLRLLQDRVLRRRFYAGTQAGRSGFSASQADYVCLGDRLLVGNLFLLERLDLLQDWLSEQAGREVRIGLQNKSQGDGRPPLPEEIAQRIRELVPRDAACVEALRRAGGAALAGTAAWDEVAAAFAASPRVVAGGSDPFATGV